MSIDIKEKLKFLGLDKKNKKVSEFFNDKEKESEELKFRPDSSFDESNFRIYKYVNIKDLVVLITPCDRMERITKRYKEAIPLSYYIDKDNENNEVYSEEFEKLLDELDLDKLKKIEKEQELLDKRIPFKVRYRENFLWSIYYSQEADKYFMLFPSNETQVEYLFYIIKKQVEICKKPKSNPNTLIYVPISNQSISSRFLNKAEIAELENYLWLFTDNWPTVYEAYDNENVPSLHIVGETKIYEELRNIYKVSFYDKDEAQSFFKLVKALFLLQSDENSEYRFDTVINDKGGIDFTYSIYNFKFKELPQFLKDQVYKKREQIQHIYEQTVLKIDDLQTIKQTNEKLTKEYMIKEKEIVTYLDCKKTFFGKVKFFFKGKKIKKQKQEQVEMEFKKQKEAEEEFKNITPEEIEEKPSYTIEDLLNVCRILKDTERKYKNIESDYKAQKNKQENLERKITNATSYINEIESHTKSIFDFWKYANKDQVSLINEGQEEEQNNSYKLRKTFNYLEDLEDFGIRVDKEQREMFTEKENEAIFASLSNIEDFNLVNKLLGKGKLYKKDENIIEKNLANLKHGNSEEKNQDRKDEISVFGGTIRELNKEKELNNSRHRESERDIYSTLAITEDLTIEEYENIVFNYMKTVKKAYKEMKCPVDISLYKVMNSNQIVDEELTRELSIFSIDPEEELYENLKDANKSINLVKVNLKEGMNAIFYTNMMYYHNTNKTLPEGMDISSKALIDLNEIDYNLVNRKTIKMNYLKNEFENKVVEIKIYEYDLDRKKLD